ncbi:histidine phosphatase family protein [Mucilaginibacter corticis]|uniref:Histidine phosphatase family protein n=1 Tax=Mucilaginibacter corticis TaxID=2597670 RepID=A0A556MMA6_9SPHI|nr:histidine phosphatase family protein [Mucilaginibacter corticis]TSJ40889.1 histidine phosphatase family protein [Mucilaginibacter corticis]
MRYLILTCLVFISICRKAQETLRVVLIRHAEKPLTGDNLSCAGFDRATRLASVIKNKFGVPSEIFAPAPATGRSTKNVRMLQTAWPMAVKYNLPINTRYTVEESDKLARTLQKRSGTVLVVWEHKELIAIAQALGVEGTLTWPANDYDTIWLITFKSGKPVLTIDHENIQPGAGCPF